MAKQADRRAGLNRQRCRIGWGAKEASDAGSVGGAKQAAMQDWWVGLNRLQCIIGGRG